MSKIVGPASSLLCPRADRGRLVQLRSESGPCSCAWSLLRALVRRGNIILNYSGQKGNWADMPYKYTCASEHSPRASSGH